MSALRPQRTLFPNSGLGKSLSEKDRFENEGIEKNGPFYLNQFWPAFIGKRTFLPRQDRLMKGAWVVVQ